MARVLIVDDQAVNRALLVAFLERDGHDLCEATSGEEALALAAQKPPDLVLLDVMMPGISGFETTRKLKDQAGESFLPIILITALTDSASKLHGLDLGADDFLTKPVARAELLARVKNLLALREKDQLLAKKNLALLELLRFKDEMSSLIVHDLKNPMSVILADYHWLAEGLKKTADPVFLETLEESHMAAARIMRILSNLLDLTAVESSRLDLHRTPTNVSLLLEGIVQQRRFVAQSRRIALAMNESPHTMLDLDVDLFTRAIENMVDNAFRHTPADGRVELCATAIGDRVQLRIGNTGKPIPVESRRTIFEKFGQAEAPTGRMNLGMGLYFCRLATELHGGKIWVEESPALQTIFVMDLPMHQAIA